MDCHKLFENEHFFKYFFSQTNFNMKKEVKSKWAVLPYIKVFVGHWSHQLTGFGSKSMYLCFTSQLNLNIHPPIRSITAHETVPV